MLEEIKSAVASLKLVLDIATAAKDLTYRNELVAAVSDVNTKLVNATTVMFASLDKQSALSSRIAELEKQLMEIEHWESQIKRYKLHSFATGTFAYELQESMQEGEPMHYLCATCVNNKVKSILQPVSDLLSCPVCKELISIHKKTPLDSNKNASSWMS